MERLASHRRPLAWGVGLWVLVVALPYGFLYPGVGLERPVAMLLAALPPLAMVIAAIAAEAHLLLGIGLASQLPVLVACPELLGPRATGPVQGVAVAVVGLAFVAAAFDHGQRGVGRSDTRLRRLWRLPDLAAGRLSLALGVVWLVLAWWPADVPSERAEAVRTARVAATAVCWAAVRTLPLARVQERGSTADTWMALLLRRMVWLGLGVGALLWLLSGQPEDL